MLAETAAWADRYVGIPWRWRGRDRDGIDCYGLLCLVYQEQCGVTLSEHSYDNHAAGAAVIEEEARHWSPVEQPAVFDVAIVDATRRLPNGGIVHGPFHIALYAGGGRALHAVEGAGVVLISSARLHCTGWYHHVPH